MPYYPYTEIKISNLTLTPGLELLPNGFEIKTNNASMHLQIKPKIQNQIAYLVLIKLGSTPVLNSTHKTFDYWKILCPNNYHSINSNSNKTLFKNENEYYYFLFSKHKTNKWIQRICGLWIERT